MKRVFPLLKVFLLLLLLLLTLCACGSSPALIRYDLDGPVTNLDPQFATGSRNQLVIQNLFDGLLRQEPDGSLSFALAQSYSVSDDELVYTFSLRQDAQWKSEQPLTARDFVFAFQRMFNALSPSPYAEDYLCLWGAKEVLAGDWPLSALGVKALDDYNLQFRLAQPEPAFLEKLCQSAALPCNQEYFEETRGKYGSTLKTTPACGPFSLSLWDGEKLYLKRNGDYYAQGQVKTPGVYLYIGRETAEQSLYDLVLSGKADACAVSFEEAQAALEEGYSCQEQVFTVWGLVLNPQHPQLRNENIRRAFIHCIHRPSLEGFLKENFSLTERLLSPELSLYGQPYLDATTVETDLFRPAQSRQERAQGLEELGSPGLEALELLVPDSGEIPYLSGMLQQMWQQNLSAFVNIVALPQEQLEQRVAAGDYDLALVPFRAESNSPYDVLSRFASGSAQPWQAGEDFDQLLQNAAQARQPEEALAAYAQAEEALYQSCAVFPLCRETSYLLFAPEVSGIQVYPYGGLVRFWQAQALR